MQSYTECFALCSGCRLDTWLWRAIEINTSRIAEFVCSCFVVRRQSTSLVRRLLCRRLSVCPPSSAEQPRGRALLVDFCPPRVCLLPRFDVARHVIPAAADRLRGVFCRDPTSLAKGSPAATGRRLSTSRAVAVRRRPPPVCWQDVATVGVALIRLYPFRQTSPCR